MNHLIAILFLGLMTFSIGANAALQIFQNKAKIEQGADLDGENEVNDNCEKEKFADKQHCTPSFVVPHTIKPTPTLVTQLSHISYQVEIRPPRG